MSDEFMWVMAPCWGCKRIISFNPDRVPSIPIDPVTQLPPDLGGDADRAEKEPICEDCVNASNEVRRRRGRPIIGILPGAYEPKMLS